MTMRERLMTVLWDSISVQGVTLYPVPEILDAILAELATPDEAMMDAAKRVTPSFLLSLPLIRSQWTAMTEAIK